MNVVSVSLLARIKRVENCTLWHSAEQVDMALMDLQGNLSSFITLQASTVCNVAALLSWAYNRVHQDSNTGKSAIFKFNT